MQIPLILPRPEAKKAAFFFSLLRCAHTFGCQHLHKWTFYFSSYPLTQHSVTHRHVHTHTRSKVLLRKPLLANLCSCQSPADCCVSNLSHTVIRKSFETLKSLIFPLAAMLSLLSNSTPPSLKPSLVSAPSFHLDMLALCFLRAPVSMLVFPFQGLARSQSVPNEDSLSAGNVDTVSTEEQLSQLGEDSVAAPQTVTRSIHGYWAFADLELSQWRAAYL